VYPHVEASATLNYCGRTVSRFEVALIDYAITGGRSDRVDGFDNRFVATPPNGARC